MENLLSIGEFASASRLSQKALRLYGENGLLAPAWVDPESGYRYYGLEQLRSATLIAFLRRSGMPLAEIRSFLREPTVARLEDFERRLTVDFAERRRVLRHVKRILKEEPMKRVLVPELDRLLSTTLEELGDSDFGPAFTLFHGPVNHDEDGPVEVCVPKANGDKRLPAGEVAFTEISGSQCQFPEILGAYEAVYRWAKEHGREPNGPAREIYLGDPAEELRMEIAVPLR